jgi:hypothetical protein
MHVLELDMPPSGCLAPGASATLKVTFRPVVSQINCAVVRLNTSYKHCFSRCSTAMQSVQLQLQLKFKSRSVQHDQLLTAV